MIYRLRSIKKDLRKGFSQLELLLVLALVAIVSVLTVPITLGQLNFSERNSVINQLESDLFSQQQKAYSGLGGENYGIIFEPSTNSYIKYTGDNYLDSTDSKIVELPDRLNISNVSSSDSTNEIKFITGQIRPTNIIEIMITGTDTYTISVNQEGLVNVSKN